MTDLIAKSTVKELPNDHNLAADFYNTVYLSI